MKKLILYLLALISIPLSTLPGLESCHDFEDNPFIKHKERRYLRKYLFPCDHPLKPVLDEIFSKSRATLNRDTLAAAGFVTKASQPRSYIIVAGHPRLPGYLLKLYLDSELNVRSDTPGWRWFQRRIRLANRIRKYIEKTDIKHFCVPKKWMYPLPLNPSPPEDPSIERKNSILIVEDMNLVSDEENLHVWKTRITEEHLKELYRIISYAGGDSYRPDNIVFTKDNKFAFIDTEYPQRRPFYPVLVQFLSPEMGDFWMKLVTGKKRPD